MDTEKVPTSYKKNKISRIAMLGLAYKAGTDSTKNSPSIMIINKLKEKYKIKAYDPIVKKLNYKNENFCFDVTNK